MNLIDEAKSIIHAASETIEECSQLANNETFVTALSEEINAIRKAKTTRKNIGVIFGVNEAGEVLMLGTTPVKASVIRECVCHVIVPVKASNSEADSLREKTYSTLSEIAYKKGKNEKEFKEIFEASVNTYVYENETEESNLTKKDWTAIAEHVVVKHILPENDETIELGDRELGSLLENLSTKKKKEATDLLENLLKLDNEVKKSRLLDKLLKENKSEDISG